MSFFEVLTGMMFAAFADAPVDVAVIEVGMGGRWDATNVADGTVAVITPIALDHMQWLGDTIEEIATEKAGIIKPGAIAVIAQQPVAAAEILLERAALVGATVAREGFEFGVLARELAVGGQQLVLQGLRGIYGDVFLPLFGAHQASNAACALAAVEAFAGVAETDPAERGRAPPSPSAPACPTEGLDPDLVRAGFAAASSPGRLDILRRSPTVIADAAHNPAGVAATVAALTESFNFERVIGVVAVARRTRTSAGVLDELEPVLSEIVVTTNSSPRAMPADELAELARDIFGEDRVQVGRASTTRSRWRCRWPTRRTRTAARGRRGASAPPPCWSPARSSPPGTPSCCSPRRARSARAPTRATPAHAGAGSVVDARRPLVKRLLVTVLSMEAVVVLLAIVPAKTLGHASAGTAGAVCGAIAVVALALCGYVGRGRGALYAGSVFQALVIASGVAAARDVRPRRDLRGALVHRHLAGPQVGARPGRRPRLTARGPAAARP